MRELRYDFRRIYHTSYDDVPIDEALSLIYALPAGSLFRAARDPCYVWSDEKYLLAEVCDRLGIMILQNSGVPLLDIIHDKELKKFWYIPRPGDAADEQQVKEAEEQAQEQRKKRRDEALKRAKEIRKTIENTDWVEEA